MRFFTVNQVNQVYVVKDVKTDTLDATAPLGTVYVKTSPDGDLYFLHIGPAGVTRSDLIDVKNVLWARLTPAAAMAERRKKVKITLNDAVNGGAPVNGEDYILNLEFTGYIGISPEDSKYWKYAAVHASSTKTPDADKFYKALALSLVDNMSREAVKFIDVTLEGSDVVLRPGMKVDDLEDETVTGVIITANESDWILGLKQGRTMNFEVQNTTITYQGEEEDGFKVSDLTDTAEDNIITNGKLIADYEYFFHGERGDQYRMVGFPNYIPTTYMVDPSKEYDVVSIHFAYIGDNQSCQKSEKDITFLIDASLNKTTSLVTAINSAIKSSGVEVKDLYTSSHTEG